MTQKPPVGIVPEEIWREKRIQDLGRAIYEYTQQCASCDPAWADELRRLLSASPDVAKNPVSSLIACPICSYGLEVEKLELGPVECGECHRKIRLTADPYFPQPKDPEDHDWTTGTRNFREILFDGTQYFDWKCTKCGKAQRVQGPLPDKVTCVNCGDWSYARCPPAR